MKNELMRAAALIPTKPVAEINAKITAELRRWSILLTSANHGTVGPLGSTFPHAGEKHERVQVMEVVESGAPPAPGADLAGLVRLDVAALIGSLDEVYSWARDLPIPTPGTVTAMHKIRQVKEALATTPVAAQTGQVATSDAELDRLADAFAVEADSDSDADLRAGGPKRLIAFDYYKRGYLAAKFGAPALAGQVAVPEMTDEQIVAVWRAMPGGPDGWLKQFGFLQFARAVLAAAPVPCAADLLEEIAHSWDGCEYPDAMIKDIGAALRNDFARFAAAPSAPAVAQQAPADFRDVTAVKRMSDQGLHLRFTSARACSEFERAAQASTAGERPEQQS